MAQSPTSSSVAMAKASASNDKIEYLYTKRRVVDLTQDDPYYYISYQQPLRDAWLLKSCGYQDPRLSEGPAPCLKFHKDKGPQDVLKVFLGDCEIYLGDSGDNKRQVLPCSKTPAQPTFQIHL
ncbi:hypothetical protein PG996_010957 [Apiospora saccharicola]|uniref:Uncharacterized protein n=1 Tax=Apiospora saccharicola TaxID=335842 RepID=A0ABR1UG19_9PEZI